MTNKEKAGSVCHTTTDTPLGSVRIWVGDNGVKKLDFESAASEVSDRTSHSNSRLLREAANQLKQYFAGTLKCFDLPLDLSNCTDFQLRILEKTREIPYGEFTSYRDLARALDLARASRSVGQALKANPVPIFLPCHRVIRSDGTLGGYAGSAAHNLQRKVTLLELEGATIKNGTMKHTDPDETLYLPF